MAVRARRSMLAPVFGGSLVLAWRALQRRDREAVSGDPEHVVLTEQVDVTEQWVSSQDGTRLHVEVSGREGAPTIVLIHGWSCSTRFWRYQQRGLADECRLVAYDLRGHGRSETPAGGDYSTDALAADLDAVLRTCAPEGERVVVAGHSMGGMSLVAWAGAHRDAVAGRLAGVVLVDTGARRLVLEARMGVTAYAPSPIRKAASRLLVGLPLPLPGRPNALLRRVMRYIALSPGASPGQVEFCTQMVLDTPARVRAAFGITLTDLDLEHALHDLVVPTVVIVGERDRLTPPSQARALAAAIPGSTLVELAGRGHMTPIEAHEELTNRLRAMAR